MAQSRSSRRKMPVHEVLVEMGKVRPTDVGAARAEGNVTDQEIITYLVLKGKVDDDDVAMGIASRHGYPYVELTDVKIPPDVRSAIDRKYQLANEIVPLEMDDLAITVAVADPSRDAKIKMDLEQQLGRMVKFCVSSPERIRAAIWGKTHQLKAKESEAKLQELDLDVMWKLFDRNDELKSGHLFGGKARELTTTGCTIEGTLPAGDEMRNLTFRKYVMKLHIVLQEGADPVRAVGVLEGKGHATLEDAFRYQVAFERLAPGDESRIQEWLDSI